MQSKITAVLGPTNTGKTYMAIDKMLGHETGIIGVPLRLLAREIYDKVSSKIGKQQVALITGEEKYIPKYPKYYICTVEAMPTDIPVDFIAIDEIQLSSDIERGHIFTKRLFQSRGNKETMFLGSSTARNILKKINPDIQIISKPRLSSIKYDGTRKISRLKKKTAIVAFSINRVYEIADFVRQQNGGTAVVLGALSPRTRNAQVELYQSGQADYLVATDAIGMGLNMDIEHVAFDSIKKFDGSKYRYLMTHEIAQIAGRAGRYKNNGTFCMTHPNADLSPEIIESVEQHKFSQITNIRWRNDDINYSSIKTILDSLSIKPPETFLKPIKNPEDHQTLEYIHENKLLDYRILPKDELQLLWDICQIPDYRQTGIENHTKIILKIFSDITENNGYVDENWLENEIQFSSRFDGDIDSLSNKISFIRTCNFIANKRNWLENAELWQDKTRRIENKLSDKLHDRLMQRFIDKRTSLIINHSDIKDLHINTENKINIGNTNIGTINGLKYVNQSVSQLNKTARSKLNSIISKKLNEQCDKILNSTDKKFILSEAHQILWDGMPIASLFKSNLILKPNIKILCDDNLTLANKKKLAKKMNQWLTNYISNTLSQLEKIDVTKMTGYLSAVRYSLIENLGIIEKENLSIKFDQLTRIEKKELRAYKIFIGERYVFFKNIFGDRQVKLRIILYNLYYGIDPVRSIKVSPKSIQISDKDTHDNKYGYHKFGKSLYRPDLIENLLNIIRIEQKIRKSQKFIITEEMKSIMTMNANEIENLVQTIGFIKNKGSDKQIYWIRKYKKINTPQLNNYQNINAFSVLKKIKNASN